MINSGGGVSSNPKKKQKLEICTADLEFESGRTLLVKAWDSRGFTRSLRLTKYAFQGVGFPRIQKKRDDQFSNLSTKSIG